MSWRGSFVTEHIDCSTCYEKAKQILTSDNSKYFCGFTVGTWGNADALPLPIIAGKLGDGNIDRQMSTFEVDFKDKLEEAICHPLTLTFLLENGEIPKPLTITLYPKESVDAQAVHLS